MTAAGITRVLVDHFIGQGRQQYACFVELARRTGGATRTCDLFVVGLWPSCQRAIAFEVKVSRSDFQRELDDPSKRRVWEAVAGECYFATPPGLVRPDEVPEGWGLYHVTDAAKVVKKAQQRKVEAWPFDFAQSLARRSADPVPPLPRGFEAELSTGSRVGVAELRRLADRIHQRDADLAHRRERSSWVDDQRRAERAQRIELGRLRRDLEQHFRCRIESSDHLRRLLEGGTGLAPDPHLAARLRELAAKLEAS